MFRMLTVDIKSEFLKKSKHEKKFRLILHTLHCTVDFSHRSNAAHLNPSRASEVADSGSDFSIAAELAAMELIAYEELFFTLTSIKPRKEQNEKLGSQMTVAELQSGDNAILK